MRCKRHPTDLSGSVGVCASCLRERLSAIIAADCRKPDPQPPPPLSFPRSASPYISQRKSDTTTAAWQLHDLRRFYSTPQVGPNGSITVQLKKNNGGRFSSLLLSFFRSRSDNKPEPQSGAVSEAGILIDSCSASPSWFSNIIPSRRKKKIRTFSIDERTCRNQCKGMSPARQTDNEDEHCQSCEYSSDAQGRWQTPQRTPASTRRGAGGRVAGHSKSISGLTFCMSPLVRPSPNHHWVQKGLQPEMVVAGDSRVTPKPHLSTAASFGKSRSRKLADFGRYPCDSSY